MSEEIIYHKCKICNGSGFTSKEFKDTDHLEYELCPKCKGNKKLDFVENILGVELDKQMEVERHASLKFAEAIDNDLLEDICSKGHKNNE